jgi:serine/threonine-protein kinase RsbW
MKQKLTLEQARLEDIEQVHLFVDVIGRDADIDEDTNFAIRLAVEEAFNNIVMHGYADKPGPVVIQAEAKNGEIVVTLQDQAPPFSPDQAPVPDLSVGLDERKIGGLGWYLIRQVMDEVRHELVAGGNLLTLVKKYPSRARNPGRD